MTNSNPDPPHSSERRLLNQTEAHIQTLLNASEVGYVLIDDNYRILRISKRAQERSTAVVGVAPEPGMDIRDFVRPQDQENFEKHYRQALQNRPVETVLELPVPDGRPLGYRFRYIPITDADGKTSGVCLTVEDITDHIALQESKARFQQLADNIDQVFWLIDFEKQKLLYVSPVLTNIWQIPLANVERNPFMLLRTVHAQDRPTVIKIMRKLLTTSPLQETAFENRIVRPTGEIRWIHSRFFPVFNEAGEFYRLAGITEDITERRRAEEQGLALRLERERVNLLANFVRDASHEFRTPLTIIEMSLFILEHSPEPALRRRKIDTIHQQSGRMAELIDSLLLMANLDTLREIEKKPLAINKIVTVAQQPLLSSIKEKSLHISLQLTKNLPLISGDQTILVPAVRALLHNAIRYTPRFGEIHVSTRATETAVQITIQDSGIGIEDDVLPHIFERFYRADKAHSTAGFGLGLPIAQRAVALHNGSLGVESTPREGSAFTIILPLDAPPQTYET